MRNLTFGILLIVAASCGVDSTETGTSFFNEGVLDYSYSDTSSVHLATVRYDKLVTGDAARLLIGSHDDERLGRLTSAAYFQVMPAGAVTLKDDDVTFDYLALTLYHDGYSYYDTTQEMTLRVHRVTEEIAVNDDGYLYNDDSFTIDEEPLGSLTFKPRPHNSDSVEIRMPDALGQEFFEKAKEEDVDLSSAADFLKYFHGLQLLADSTVSASLVGFAVEPELRLYYKDRSVTPVEQKYISFKASGVRSVKVTTDRGTSALADLTDPYDKVNAEETDDVSFIQAGGGLALRVEIPYLRELKQVENFYVLRAVLELYTVRRSGGDYTPMPSQLMVYPVDRDNVVIGQFDAQALLIEDLDLGRDNRYALDVTSFVKTQMETVALNNNALLFTLTDNFPVSANRLYAAAASGNYDTRVRIYYATLNN
ncbi:DUF4270 family protein [Dawidia soli]|uniref:DUF4270 family protein n=1 Tax=Dawidia soli TaxID=2782352 RepID=A0AAP2GKE5_9BACT|nr:DUF4270 family protein [Dawidia soli]MBT1689540.1 DUF4270 family protein [Dawidia soli]